MKDTYLSVIESLRYASWKCGMAPEVSWIDSETLETDRRSVSKLSHCDGILIPGGFGARGIEGKISAAKFAREHCIPYFGLCLGFQIMVIEYARHVLGLRDATSEEFNERSNHPVIHTMQDQKEKLANREYGATMRLGSYPCLLVSGTLAHKAYYETRWSSRMGATIHERHRHRYEVNNAYREQLETRGLRVSGIYEAKHLIEIMEVVDHPWMLGVQFHPEFLSRPLNPHPLFLSFIRACVNARRKK